MTTFTTGWFQLVQTMASFAFICNILMIIMLIITASTSFRASVKFLTATATLGALTFVFSLVAVIVFGIATDSYSPLNRFTGLGLDIFSDRGKWMPRPEYTFLSWSYICEVFCSIFSLISSEFIMKACLFVCLLQMNKLVLNIFLNILGTILFFETLFIRKAKILYEKSSLRSSFKSMP